MLFPPPEEKGGGVAQHNGPVASAQLPWDAQQGTCPRGQRRQKTSGSTVNSPSTLRVTLIPTPPSSRGPNPAPKSSLRPLCGVGAAPAAGPGLAFEALGKAPWGAGGPRGGLREQMGRG